MFWKKPRHQFFIFGATIEGHSPYNNKYNDVNVQAISDVYSESALEELSAYGQTAYDLDQQMGRLFNYLDQCETPTLVFVFGDHLPPLQAYSENNYLEDTVEKVFRTVGSVFQLFRYRI